MRNVTNLFEDKPWPGHAVEKADIAKVNGWLCDVALALHRDAQHRQDRGVRRFIVTTKPPSRQDAG